MIKDRYTKLNKLIADLDYEIEGMKDLMKEMPSESEDDKQLRKDADDRLQYLLEKRKIAEIRLDFLTNPVYQKAYMRRVIFENGDYVEGYHIRYESLGPEATPEYATQVFAQ